MLCLFSHNGNETMVLKFSKFLVRVLSSYALAVICLSLIFILTWLSTLEQPDKGLYLVQQRYFSAESWFVSPELDFIPKVNGNSICPPLPSAYLISIILTINLVIGGLIRIKKNKKKWGVILSHFSMVGLLFSGFISHHYSREGMMLIYQGDISNYAQSYTDYTIEIAIYHNGLKEPPYVIPSKSLMGLSSNQTLKAKIPSLNLQMDISKWMPHSSISHPSAQSALVATPLKPDPQAEKNLAACVVKIAGSQIADTTIQLHASLRETRIPLGDNKEIGIQLIKEIWNIPFYIKLNTSIGEYHPNTNRPKYFESQITQMDTPNDPNGYNYTIKMNEPFRQDGYTLYQARWMGDSDRPQSGFAVVQNPADQWPKYCLYLSIIGLTAHFGLKLSKFLTKRSNK